MSTLANTDIMFQVATYWAPATPNGYGGGTFPEPVQINCRWEFETGLTTDGEGSEIQSTAVVYPDQEVAEDGWLYLGVSAEADPHDEEGAYIIRKFRMIPDQLNELHEYKATL